MIPCTLLQLEHSHADDLSCSISHSKLHEYLTGGGIGNNRNFWVLIGCATTWCDPHGSAHLAIL